MRYQAALRPDGNDYLTGSSARTALDGRATLVPVDHSACHQANLGTTLPPSAIAGAPYDEHQMRVLDSER